MPACKVMAKDLVRTRRHIHKFYQMKTNFKPCRYASRRCAATSKWQRR